MNVRVLLPTERPSTSASVASASHRIAVTCCALRPMFVVVSYDEGRCINERVVLTASFATTAVTFLTPPTSTSATRRTIPSYVCDAYWLGGDCCEGYGDAD